jgi:hypothetical protein
MAPRYPDAPAGTRAVPHGVRTGCYVGETLGIRSGNRPELVFASVVQRRIRSTRPCHGRRAVKEDECSRTATSF